MACQVSSLRGEVLARSHNNPEQPMQSLSAGFHDQVIDGAAWRTFTLDRGDVRITTADRQVEREALNLSVLLAASVPVGMALMVCLLLLWLGIGQGLMPLNRMRDALMRRDADSLQPLQISPLPSELKPLLDFEPTVCPHSQNHRARTTPDRRCCPRTAQPAGRRSKPTCKWPA